MIGMALLSVSKSSAARRLRRAEARPAEGRLAPAGPASAGLMFGAPARLFGACALAMLPATTIAAPNVPISECLDAAATVKPGEFAKVEYLDPSAEGVPAFVIEVRDEAGESWELSCDARSGAIYEIESEVSGPDDPRFADTAELTTADAEARALALVPGRTLEVEYEVDANGDPVFELDIEDSDGVERKIEVHAVTGEILETSVEHWEIGIEASERR